MTISGFSRSKDPSTTTTCSSLVSSCFSKPLELFRNVFSNPSSSQTETAYQIPFLSKERTFTYRKGSPTPDSPEIPPGPPPSPISFPDHPSTHTLPLSLSAFSDLEAIKSEK